MPKASDPIDPEVYEVYEAILQRCDDIVDLLDEKRHSAIEQLKDYTDNIIEQFKAQLDFEKNISKDGFESNTDLSDEIEDEDDDETLNEDSDSLDEDDETLKVILSSSNDEVEEMVEQEILKLKHDENPIIEVDDNSEEQEPESEDKNVDSGKMENEKLFHNLDKMLENMSESLFGDEMTKVNNDEKGQVETNDKFINETENEELTSNEHTRKLNDKVLDYLFTG
ncbi:hypothetical protein BLOT_002070 [Blomia tropicalis]|nr:hypothetical protein BLOT_002070 [Blomia tropicalis]